MSYDDTCSQDMLIQGQRVRVDTTIKDFSAKQVSYDFVSPQDMHPMTVGIAMLCIVQSIFIDQGHDILEALGVPNPDLFFGSKQN